MPVPQWTLLLLLLLRLFGAGATPPPTDTARLVRTIGVAQGLPQSFISGLVQDAQGFIWIGTRDGLARYDGRRFKVFNHLPGDTATLAGSVITNLYYTTGNQLWIAYGSGEIDILNTATEKLQHLSLLPSYRAARGLLKANITAVKSFATDEEGNVWMPGKQGVFIFNLFHNRLQVYSNQALRLPGITIYVLARYGREMLLVTDTAFVVLNAQRRITRLVPYHFPRPWLHSLLTGKDTYPLVRGNGDIVLLDENRLIIYHPATGLFTYKALPPANLYVFSSVLKDEAENIFFDFNGAIYQLSPNDSLTVWRGKTPASFQSQCMLLDRSGVLWVGGNGSAIRMYDRRLTHLQGQPYSDPRRLMFIQDVLRQNLSIAHRQLQATFLDTMYNYWLRWVQTKEGKLWLAEGGEYAFNGHTCTLDNGQLQQQTWKLNGLHNAPAGLKDINGLACSRSGQLWGIDYDFHLVAFDAASGTATIYPTLTDTVQRVNSMLIDGETVFWISSVSKGLFRYDRATGSLLQYAPGQKGRDFPTLNPSILVQDASDSSKLWIGTMGNGLLHFDKRTGQSKIYTTANGLPNNTVYTILCDAAGQLWGSTNKGIFRFNPATGNVYSFTSNDGLPGDEFNRHHFLALPNGRFAFGGVDGYVVFDPLKVAGDNFEPETALTAISINNKPSDYGWPASPLPGAINSLQTLELPYTSNILGFEFAALEYNIPEKLRYRYKLEGFDEAWVDAGLNNTAVYTGLPPGEYTLQVNATNTGGKWSPHIKQLFISIRPPFWKTPLFILLCSLAAVRLLYGAIQARIASIRNQAKRQLAYEREAMELEAQALRAQMNPHFVFNCLNSIKSLIQENKKREAVLYLTTFSKLIRSQLTNAQKEVSLYEELETCRLYTQLEALRFGDKVRVVYEIEEGVPIHSVLVPPLIIQPFIENAIWHGILPKETGGEIKVTVRGEAGGIGCTIEDDGIGRQTSQLNKSPASTATHQSKGMQLTQERLHLYSRIYNRGGRLEVMDKTTSAGAPAGTCVILHFETEI